MSFRVPMLHGTRRKSDFVPHGFLTFNRSTVPAWELTEFPVALTRKQYLLCLRVKQWKVSIDVTFDYVPHPGTPEDDLNGAQVNVSNGIMAAYADSYTHWYNINGGISFGEVDDPADHTLPGFHPGLQATKEYQILSNFTRDNREFSGDPNTKGDIAPFMVVAASTQPDEVPRLYYQVIQAFQGDITGTWVEIGGTFEYVANFLTLVSPQGGNEHDSLVNFSTGMYDPVTGLIYPLIRWVCTFAPPAEQLQTVQDASGRPVAGTATIHIPASAKPIMERPDDIDIDFPMYQSTPTGHFRFPSNAIEFTIEPLVWWPYKTSDGEEVYDIATGDIRNRAGDIPISPFD